MPSRSCDYRISCDKEFQFESSLVANYFAWPNISKFIDKPKETQWFKCTLLINVVLNALINCVLSVAPRLPPSEFTFFENQGRHAPISWVHIPPSPTTPSSHFLARASFVKLCHKYIDRAYSSILVDHKTPSKLAPLPASTGVSNCLTDL